MITLLTREGVVTRPRTPTEKRERTRGLKREQEEKARRDAAQAWLTALLESVGLTRDDDKALPGVRNLTNLVASLSWRTGDDRERFEWLLRQSILIDLELRARYWRIGKRLRAKILAAVAAEEKRMTRRGDGI